MKKEIVIDDSSLLPPTPEEIREEMQRSKLKKESEDRRPQKPRIVPRDRDG